MNWINSINSMALCFYKNKLSRLSSFVLKRYKKKTSLTAQDLGWKNNNTAIYINDNLPPKQASLAGKTRQALKQKGYAINSRNGAVTVFHEETKKKATITLIEDFEEAIEKILDNTNNE